jgi:hypothetical protein
MCVGQIMEMLVEHEVYEEVLLNLPKAAGEDVEQVAFERKAASSA